VLLDFHLETCREINVSIATLESKRTRSSNPSWQWKDTYFCFDGLKCTRHFLFPETSWPKHMCNKPWFAIGFWRKTNCESSHRNQTAVATMGFLPYLTSKFLIFSHGNLYCSETSQTNYPTPNLAISVTFQCRLMNFARPHWLNSEDIFLLINCGVLETLINYGVFVILINYGVLVILIHGKCGTKFLPRRRFSAIL